MQGSGYADEVTSILASDHVHDVLDEHIFTMDCEIFNADFLYIDRSEFASAIRSILAR